MSTKKPCKIHTQKFQAEAPKLADKIGVAAAARELNLYESELYNWLSSVKKKSNTTAREAELAAEVARLKRQLTEQEEDF
ncbi:MAG TPA: hypothetical protein DCY70_14210 [Shewanella sp.]|nr:hypothetical protein [Shewanella sp.]